MKSLASLNTRSPQTAEASYAATVYAATVYAATVYAATVYAATIYAGDIRAGQAIKVTCLILCCWPERTQNGVLGRDDLALRP